MPLFIKQIMSYNPGKKSAVGKINAYDPSSKWCYYNAWGNDQFGCMFGWLSWDLTSAFTVFATHYLPGLVCFAAPDQKQKAKS